MCLHPSNSLKVDLCDIDCFFFVAVVLFITGGVVPMVEHLKEYWLLLP